MIEDLLQWDLQKQVAKGKGVLGTVKAFAPADEEQGRKTLHSHWQIWVEELNQKLRDQLFDNDETKKTAARKRFTQLIDSLLHTSYGPDLKVEHVCNNANSQPASEPILASNVFEDREHQVFRNARHRTLCHDVKGRVMQCVSCGSEVSTTDIINLALESWRNKATQDGSLAGIKFPLSSERLDIAAYRHSYDMNGGCITLDNAFWGNQDVRDTLLRLRFDEHEWNHRASCFKKGCDCRFFLPEPSNQETGIYTDPGEDGEKVVAWYRLKEGDVLEVPPWMVHKKRPMGCQYLNTHSKPISDVLNCNTNIQIGDRSQVFYSTLYCGKSTQKEDAERQQRINHNINRRLLRIEGEVLDGTRVNEEVQDGFVEGLCRMLSGMNAATSRNVISATMQHLLVSNGGSRFNFSHGFGNLLVGQLEATLEHWPVDVRVRTNVLKGKIVVWQDSASDDYVHRPAIKLFETMCAYQMTMYYKKTCKTFNEMKNTASGSTPIEDDENDGDLDYDGINEAELFNGQGYERKRFAFKKSHPGKHFSHLARLKQWVVPRVYMPEDKLCKIELLKLDDVGKVDEETKHLREIYAKFALLMFYPCRKLSDLKKHGRYWSLFYSQLKCYRKREKTTFWKKGFHILQNIQDRMTLDKNMKRATDFITNVTTCQAPEENKNKQLNTNDDGDIDDILDFCKPKR